MSRPDYSGTCISEVVCKEIRYGVPFGQDYRIKEDGWVVTLTMDAYAEFVRTGWVKKLPFYMGQTRAPVYVETAIFETKEAYEAFANFYSLKK
jgi:hypothetical protein